MDSANSRSNIFKDVLDACEIPSLLRPKVRIINQTIYGEQYKKSKKDMTNYIDRGCPYYVRSYGIGHACRPLPMLIYPISDCTDCIIKDNDYEDKNIMS